MTNKPIYMIPEGDPKIAEWKPTFDMIEPKANLPITINVEPDVVDSGEIAFLQDVPASKPSQLPLTSITVDFNYR